MDYQAYLNSDAWKQLRGVILKRDSHQCQTCLSKQNLEVHHKTYERLGNEDLNDLITLCHSCHDAITTSINTGKSQRPFLPIPERIKLSLEQRAELTLMKICLSSPQCLTEVLRRFDETEISRCPEYEQMWESVLKGDRPEELETLLPVFYEMSDPVMVESVINTAFLCIERGIREKRYFHFLNLWQETDPIDPEWHSYYQAFYTERLRLQEIDRQRQNFVITGGDRL